jgi:hypothetical protein
MWLSCLIDGHTGRVGKVFRDVVAKLEGGIPIVTAQNPEVITRYLGLVKDAGCQITRIGIQREDEGLDEALREAVDETEKEKGNRKTSECYPKVDGFEGDPAASRNGQHPGDLEC